MVIEEVDAAHNRRIFALVIGIGVLEVPKMGEVTQGSGVQTDTLAVKGEG